MKILLRKYNNKYYVWKPAVWEGGDYYLFENKTRGARIYMDNIIAVTEDTRANFVVCKNCGKLIENTPESIERHFAEQEAMKDCLKCSYLTQYGDKRQRKVTYTPTDNGNYAAIETYETLLGCKAGYWTQEIHSSAAQRDCVYARCRKLGVAEINDVFVKYPNPFDKHITIDLLTDKKYHCEGYIDGYYRYDLKCRNTVKACVNELGIVDHFLVSMRGGEFKFYYSARHNKIFFKDWNKYDEKWGDFISEAKHEQILTKLSKLYEEASTNE